MLCFEYQENSINYVLIEFRLNKRKRYTKYATYVIEMQVINNSDVELIVTFLIELILIFVKNTCKL